MSYRVKYTDYSAKDLSVFDKSQAIQIKKMIAKVSENPLPISEGGYGKPLGNKAGNSLTGYLKIKLLKLGIRVVYRLDRKCNHMVIIVIAARDDNEVYDIAASRI